MLTKSLIRSKNSELKSIRKKRWHPHPIALNTRCIERAVISMACFPGANEFYLCQAKCT
jgi:hypothetical protein